jgi:hypothetical protein
MIWTLFSSYPLLNGNKFRLVKHFSDEMIFLPCYRHYNEGFGGSSYNITSLWVWQDILCWPFQLESFKPFLRKHFTNTIVSDSKRCLLDKWLFKLVKLMLAHLGNEGIILEFLLSIRRPCAISHMLIVPKKMTYLFLQSKIFFTKYVIFGCIK